MFLRSEGAFRVSIDRDDSTRAWHLELEVCIMRHRVEPCKRGSSEQGMIADAERDYVEDSLLAPEVIRGSEDHFQCD